MENKIGFQTIVFFGAFIMASVSSIYSNAVSCGDVLDSGKTVVLESDLNCAISLTVTNGTTLDLNGHTFSCGANFPGGIILDGAGSVLKNGTIDGECLPNVSLKGIGGHLVRNITITRGVDEAFVSESNGNVIENCNITSDADGFKIFGNHNWLINNLVSTSRKGFVIDASNTCLLRNKAYGNDEDGFIISSINSQLLRNVADGNGDVFGPHGEDLGFGLAIENSWLVRNGARRNSGDGIRVSGGNNLMVRNRAKDNGEPSLPDEDRGVDLVDANPDCDENIWKKNFFGTRDPDTCIE